MDPELAWERRQESIWNEFCDDARGCDDLEEVLDLAKQHDVDLDAARDWARTELQLE